MQDFTELTYGCDDRVATITINRPERNNAWTPTLESELRSAITIASDDSDVRAIILTGAGKSFCVGADRDALKAASERGKPLAQTIAGNGDFEQRYSYLLACPKPLIAAINGPASGVGFCLTLYCDLRYIRAGAKLSSGFARIGLPAEHGSAWLLPRLIGPMKALDMLLSGRPFTSVEIDAIGLAQELPIENFLPAVHGLAAQIANACSPLSLKAIKRQVYGGLNQSLAEAIYDADRLRVDAIGSDDFKEGVACMIEKRPPAFPGR